jgi:hypothetical protein
MGVVFFRQEFVKLSRPHATRFILTRTSHVWIETLMIAGPSSCLEVPLASRYGRSHGPTSSMNPFASLHRPIKPQKARATTCVLRLYCKGSLRCSPPEAATSTQLPGRCLTTSRLELGSTLVTANLYETIFSRSFFRSASAIASFFSGRHPSFYFSVSTKYVLRQLVLGRSGYRESRRAEREDSQREVQYLCGSFAQELDKFQEFHTRRPRAMVDIRAEESERIEPV